VAFHGWGHRGGCDLLDGGVRVVCLAHRWRARHPGGLGRITRGHGHTGLAALGRSDDALPAAAKVTEHRAVRDSSTALVTEQGEASCGAPMASPTYLKITRPVSLLRPFRGGRGIEVP